VLIADVSTVYKKMFAKAAAELDKTAFIDYAAGGDETLDKIRRQDYDIIIIDAETTGTGMGGLLKAISVEIPKASVLFAARPSPANVQLCEEALDSGAADYLIKPINDSYDDNYIVVRNKLAEVYRTLGEKRGRGSRPAPRKSVRAAAQAETGGERTRKHIRKSKFSPELVLIAASTGGPLALEQILSGLKADFPVPILVVQHMPAHFTSTLAQHLDQKATLRVKLAENREPLAAGTVYIAPGGVHMKLDAKNQIRVDDSPPINGVRPAADILFESVADYFSGTSVLAVVLTGMGCDGERGLAQLKEKRECYCLAQSERTCVVYGMPRAVIENGLADKIVDLDKMAGEISSFHYL
ncbi:MAG: hypothetical protein FWE80_05260, partial [Oscillospiraceae bacterium]|nr:hypothetical protein [Oscillospiraceae bacterium]